MKKLTLATRKKVAKAILDSNYDFDTMMSAIPSGAVGEQIMNEVQEMDNDLFDGLIYWTQCNCKAETKSKPKASSKSEQKVIRGEEAKVTKERLSPYERTRRAVYATGNKWAIENFNATH